MVGALMEHVLAPEKIDGIFTQNAGIQYEWAGLLSTTVDVMSEVVCGVRPSIHAAYRRKKKHEEISISTGRTAASPPGWTPRASRGRRAAGASSWHRSMRA
jgi:hypothetical protein